MTSEQEHDNVLEYVMVDNDGKKHSVFYYLYDTTFKHKWVELVKQNFKGPDAKVFSSYQNSSKKDRPVLTKLLQDCVSRINDHFGPAWTLPIYDRFDEEKLNELHDKFEDWGEIRETVEYRPENESTDEYWFDLNRLIHQCEAVLISEHLNTSLTMGAVIDIHPRGLKNKLLEEDKILLTTQFKWGGLYLGYNTLGKDYIAAMIENDISAIEKDRVRPQKGYAAETWLHFGFDMITAQLAQGFSKWVKTLPQDIQTKIPTNLNDLTLGRIVLGKLLPHKTPSCMEMDSNLTHWEISRHSCKEEWNIKYFSTFVECVEMNLHTLFPKELGEFVQLLPSQEV